MANQIVRPESRKEFMSKLETPYLGAKKPVFSDTTKLGQPENNRALEISLKGDRNKEIKIGIRDIDEAVMYYFKNVLKLSVIQNNTRQEVPVMYGDQETWKSMQLDGYYRDSSGKMQVPLLMFKRVSINQNQNLGFKLDGNQAHNFQYFESTYNKRNFYSNFNLLNSRVPEKKYIVSVTPDYVTVEYSCIIWTYFVEQMDILIEALNFASRSYWGDPNKFLFYSSIDSFKENITYILGEDRAVKNEFTIILNGYLIPETLNKKLANSTLAFGLSSVTFGLETSNTLGSKDLITTTANIPQNQKGSVVTNDSVNVVNNISTGVNAAQITYLTANKQLLGSYISPNQIGFSGSFAIAPTGFPSNNVNNFTFFVNSTYIDAAAITSFVDNGNSTCTLTVNTGSLGFAFDTNDQSYYAIGKFS